MRPAAFLVSLVFLVVKKFFDAGLLQLSHALRAARFGTAACMDPVRAGPAARNANGMTERGCYGAQQAG